MPKVRGRRNANFASRLLPQKGGTRGRMRGFFLEPFHPLSWLGRTRKRRRGGYKVLGPSSPSNPATRGRRPAHAARADRPPFSIAGLTRAALVGNFVASVGNYYVRHCSSNFPPLVIASVAKQSRVVLHNPGLPRRLRLLAMTRYGISHLRALPPETPAFAGVTRGGGVTRVYGGIFLHPSPLSPSGERYEVLLLQAIRRSGEGAAGRGPHRPSPSRLRLGSPSAGSGPPSLAPLP